jgi:hypothetical protein
VVWDGRGADNGDGEEGDEVSELHFTCSDGWFNFFETELCFKLAVESKH